MSNFGGYLIRLGADPETIQLGKTEGRKLRCADNTRGKKAVTRWFNAIVTGKDCETADRLRKGDRLFLTGQLVQEEYDPKKPRYRGEKVKTDVMPYAKILEVVQSPTYFGEADDDGVTATGDGLAAEEGSALDGVPDLTGDADPLADV